MPSPGLHPAGSRYRWEAGLGPGEIELAEIPRLLLDQAEYEPQEMASIVNAAWRGDLARVAEALADGMLRTRPPPMATPRSCVPSGPDIRPVRDCCSRRALIPTSVIPLGRPALLLASEVAHTGVMAALLEAGAGVEARDPDGRTPLHGACWGGHDSGG